MSKQEPLGLLIGAARRRIKQAVGRRLQGHGLSPQQFWVLVAIGEMERPSLREVAARHRIDAPTASRILATLVRRRLVKVEVDPRDRRRSRLALTPAGSGREQAVRPLAAEVRRAVVRGLRPSELAVMRRGLRKVVANMDAFGRGGRGSDRA